MNYQHIKEEYLKIHKNFMTPIIRDYIILPDSRVLELSEGTAIDGSRIFGVTEFETIDGRLQTTRRGQMHTSIIQARKHYNNLK